MKKKAQTKPTRARRSSPAIDTTRLADQLKELRLPTFREQYPMAAEQAARRAMEHGVRKVDVVVKVQRTGLSATIATDRAAIMQLAHLVQRRTPLGLSVQPEELAREFIESVEEELDFMVEARNGVELASGLADIDGIRVPGLYLEHSTSKVLTEEYISAPNIADEHVLAPLSAVLDDHADIEDVAAISAGDRGVGKIFAARATTPRPGDETAPAPRAGLRAVDETLRAPARPGRIPARQGS